MSNEVRLCCIITVVIVMFNFMFGCSGGGAGSDTDMGTPVPYYLSGSTSAGNDIGVKIEGFNSLAQAATSENERSLSGFLNFDDITLNCSGTLEVSTGLFSLSARGSFGTTELVFTITGCFQASEAPPFSDVELSLIVLEDSNLIGSYHVELSYEDTPVSVQNKMADIIDPEDLDPYVDYVGIWGETWDDPAYGYVKMTVSEAAFSFVTYNSDEPEDPYEITNGSLLEITIGSAYNASVDAYDGDDGDGYMTVCTWIAYSPSYDEDSNQYLDTYLAGKTVVLTDDEETDWIFAWFVGGNPHTAGDDAGPGENSYQTDYNALWSAAQSLSVDSLDVTEEPPAGTYSFLMPRFGG